MTSQLTSVEILALENNALAVEHAIEVLKVRLSDAPDGVLNDVLQRCDPQTHTGLIEWISAQPRGLEKARPPRTWSPKKNRRLWVLYAAADLDRPKSPPN